MKKLTHLVIGLALVSSFALIGCAQNDAKTPGANPTSTENKSGMSAVPQESVGNSSVPAAAGDGDASGK